MALHLDLVTARFFVAIVEEASIARAAARENIAPSAISKRVSELEQRFGVTLLRRHHRGVEPTPAGAVLLRRARGLLHEAAQLEVELRQFAAGERGHIRLFANETAIIGFLPRHLALFTAAHPQVRIDVAEALSEDIVRAVEENAGDIGIFDANVPSRELWVRACFTDRLVAVVAAGHPLARHPRVALDELLDHDLIGQERRSAVGLLLQRGAAALGRVPRIRVRVDGFDAVCCLVSEGVGAGLVTADCAAMLADALNLVVVPLAEPWADREHRLCARDPDDLPPVARLLLQHLAGGGSGAVD
ncbi:DNA-binding transcriptional LysR family regulator [Stella humosa]|uniref:DNA-binding transcriptional LysR family regulator n=1 Tax=Stella humosa TaxID=94 RepID=A0A3N1KSA8_9PROT|nr:LysR family transcriptional regulator [Stella humosa]ROP83471.1 DNA-binding transcriptional LysR family regulator [Stella humosa]BBK33257.1 transcriptional regulator [Stella humosa]